MIGLCKHLLHKDGHYRGCSINWSVSFWLCHVWSFTSFSFFFNFMKPCEQTNQVLKKKWNWVCHGRLNTLYLVVVSEISPKEGVYWKSAKVKSWYWEASRHGLDQVHQRLQIWMIWYSIKFIGFIILYANFSTLFIKFTFCLFMGLFHSITFILM